MGAAGAVKRGAGSAASALPLGRGRGAVNLSAARAYNGSPGGHIKSPVAKEQTGLPVEFREVAHAVREVQFRVARQAAGAAPLPTADVTGRARGPAIKFLIRIRR